MTMPRDLRVPLCCGVPMERFQFRCADTTTPDADGQLWSITSAIYKCPECGSTAAKPTHFRRRQVAQGA